MKILTVTTLFPYANNPKHGVFIETRLRHLMAHFPDVEVKVIAPVPWFPFRHPVFGEYAEYAKAPAREQRFGMDVYHPRYVVIPKIGMTLTPRTLSGAIYHQARQLQEQGFDFDVIDGHYFYPDGVAIEQAATRLGKPFTVTARGTDINLIPQFPAPKKAIQTVLQKSGHNMAVCEALRQTMIALGAAPNSVTTLRNGVDLTLFPFADTAKQADLRQQLKLPSHQPVVLSVGHLIERKGHHLVIDAMKNVPDAVLVIAGSGPEEKALHKQVHNNGLASRISFVGSVSQKELAQYYGAANALVLASSREGWANVLLESMACGTPVVASNIWGTPEVVRTADAGLLVERTPEAIAAGMNALLTSPPLRSDTRRYAEQFDWLSTSQGQHAIFSSLISKTAHGR
ncbi:glycosyltransferase family 4 protein [Enterovibrio paralichthyis]|uniref:glycosyltransferase family 4 protein n=1 Tax=Enterovibrio paralichthyis TaxID=2853805 RepID=UPI001C4726AC|nr:glycosyltransferase family 4 protein [Enterovibrio paralichthyis]MBV7299738.1 glycosyltransferase family 4 protein [Enterovibrio paralichthyis]